MSWPGENMTSLDRKLIRDLKHYRAQVTAISLVVACGIASFIAMRSNYNSLTSSQQLYYRAYRFTDVFAPVKRAPESLVTNINSIPGVAEVNTRIVMEVTLDIPGLEEPATGRLISIPDLQTSILNDIYIRHGRYPEPSGPGEVLVSEAFASANKLKLGDGIDSVINGRWQRLEIVGIAISPEYIYEIRGTEVLPDSRRFGVFWMNDRSLAAAYDMEAAFNDVALSLSPGASKAEVITQLDRLLGPYGGTGAYGREDQISHNFIKGEIDETRVTSTVVPSIFLAVAAFLINIVLSRLVATQRNQIGLMKAFGYSNPAIGFHFLKFAVLCVLGGSILGSLIGLWAGSALGTIYERFFHFPIFQYRAGLPLLSLSFFISLAAATVGAITGVRKAVQLPPAEAMRPEPPAAFHAGWLERFGFNRMISINARLIVRNIARRPVKASLSALGIALAVAVMVVGLYFFDAMDHLMRLQFHTIQREDATVVFQNNLGPAVVNSVLHLPGVIQVEPYRVVPARLRFGHRSKRIGILGLQPDGDLRRIVDQKFRKVQLPAEGIVLTDVLAEDLGIRPGQTLTVEILEGARPVREIILTATVDEPIGLSGYMNLDALHRLLEEAPVFSGCLLSVDSSATGRLYSTLKKTPVIAGVSIREVMLKSFQQTIAQSLQISLDMLIGFACVIAFSMVYNGARIALSERGHELASLRVLGFTRNEISWMLLGEQALLMLFATPAGFLIGYGICVLATQGKASDLYRLPIIVTPRTYTFAFLVTFLSSLVSGYLIVRRIRHLDLIEVLKTRE